MAKRQHIALGALGRMFESCRPDHLKPSHTSEFPRLAFLLFVISNEKGALEEALEEALGSSKIPNRCLIILLIY